MCLGPKRLLTVLQVPMAVGRGVLTTCNYKAREFGVRSGMAGHIAKSMPNCLTVFPYQDL